MLVCVSHTQAQFAPAAGLPGTTAIWKDSSAFVEWATGCTVQRGPMNIANPALGNATVGDSTSALGKAGENGVVSLGDGGMATVTFAHPIFNGPGFDFAVFENGFMTNDSNLAFLELAFVEVSSDGVNFFRFPAVSNTEDTIQMAMQGMDCSPLNNLAGKYIVDYGTPFDLEELKDQPGLDVNKITHVRIIDVVGCIDSQYATHDVNGRRVNDPWPTPYPSCGFDLDAVGVINVKGMSGIEPVANSGFKIFPNPVIKGHLVNINLPDGAQVEFSNLSGQVLQRGTMSNGQWRVRTDIGSGIYFIGVRSETENFNAKLIVE